MTGILSMGLGALGTKRRAFFSFHYDDIMRVNNVRNAWKITHPDSATFRSFYDSSLWESRKLEGDDAVKRLIREGVEYTSAICVLIGTHTWSRRWVRYEIARAIIDGRGLLGVHLNGIPHHQRHMSDPLGTNPLMFMGIGKVQQTPLSIPQYHLFEVHGGGWRRYPDYTSAIARPAWMPEPPTGQVYQLSMAARSYDYHRMEGGKNIGSWVDAAAVQAGR